MDDIGGLIGGIILLVIAVYAIAFALLLFMFVGPPVGAFYWLHRLSQRYELSRRKRIMCLCIAILTAAAPALLLIFDPNTLQLVLWLGLVLSPTATGFYLVCEAYRQHKLQYRVAATKVLPEIATMRYRLFRNRRNYGQIQAAITDRERRYAELLAEVGNLRSTLERFMLTHDTMVFSSEKSRIEQQISGFSSTSLRSQYERSLGRLRELAESDPLLPRQLLELAILRLAWVKSLMAVDRRMSYDEALARRSSLHEGQQDLERSLLQKSAERQRALSSLGMVHANRLHLS